MFAKYSIEQGLQDVTFKQYAPTTKRWNSEKAVSLWMFLWECLPKARGWLDLCRRLVSKGLDFNEVENSVRLRDAYSPNDYHQCRNTSSSSDPISLQTGSS